jgi:hypothetical protein
LFQLAVSPFNWIDQEIEKVGEKVGRMLNKKASRGKTAGEVKEETIIEKLTKKYPWWMPTAHVEKVATPSDRMEDTVSMFEGKNTRVR